MTALLRDPKETALQTAVDPVFQWEELAVVHFGIKVITTSQGEKEIRTSVNLSSGYFSEIVRL